MSKGWKKSTYLVKTRSEGNISMYEIELSGFKMMMAIFFPSHPIYILQEMLT